MGGSSKGGEQTTVTKLELPPEIKKAAIDNLKLADEIGSMGYVPWMSNTQAGLGQGEKAAWAMGDAARDAFGLQNTGLHHADMNVRNGYDPFSGMNVNEEAGIVGTGPGELYASALNRIPEGQMTFLRSLVMNPFSGAPAANPVIPKPQYKTWEHLPSRQRVPDEYLGPVDDNGQPIVQWGRQGDENRREARDRVEMEKAARKAWRQEQ